MAWTEDESELYGDVLTAKNAQIADLKAELADCRLRLRAELDRAAKLWAAVGELKYAVGLGKAWGLMDDNANPGQDDFDTAVENAETLLDGVIGLKAATE